MDIWNNRWFNLWDGRWFGGEIDISETPSEFRDILRSLFPKGLAFRFFSGSYFRQLSEALAKEPGRIINFFRNVRASGIPDANLPAESFDDWEAFLALSQNDSLSESERRNRIIGKFTGQGGQGPDYIQQVLQDAGYPLYVTENIPDESPSVKAYTARLGGFSLAGSTLGAYTDRVDPRSVSGYLIAGPPIFEAYRNYLATCGNATCGEYTSGAYSSTQTIEVEYQLPSDSSLFVFVWFLTGPAGLNDFVNIPTYQYEDLRKLILQIKPAHSWCIAQINLT